MTLLMPMAILQRLLTYRYFGEHEVLTLPISKPLDALSAQKKPFIFYNLNALLNEAKNGGLVYYVSDLSVGDGPLDFTDATKTCLSFR